jgi:hypothetical protein
MRRVALPFGISCLAVMCSCGIWLAFRPPIQSLLSSDATNTEVDATGRWEWTLTYRSSDRPYGWYFTIVRQLEEEGWMESGERYVGGPPHNPATYTRKTSFEYVVVWERVEIGGQPHVGDVRMWRWISLAWPLPAVW